jgi:hypothetical protein
MWGSPCHLARSEQGTGRSVHDRADDEPLARRDIIVNTDADNQYKASHIPLLIGPILRHEAEIVIGARLIGDIEHFRPSRKGCSGGSAVTRWVSDTNVWMHRAAFAP